MTDQVGNAQFWATVSEAGIHPDQQRLSILRVNDLNKLCVICGREPCSQDYLTKKYPVPEPRKPAK